MRRVWIKSQPDDAKQARENLGAGSGKHEKDGGIGCLECSEQTARENDSTKEQDERCPQRNCLPGDS